LAGAARTHDHCLCVNLTRCTKNGIEKTHTKTPSVTNYQAFSIGKRCQIDRLFDAGTGDGAWLDALAPIYDRVVAVDRSPQQLARAAERVALRGYSNVTLLCAEVGDDALAREVGDGADLVVAARVLHHAARPWVVLAALVRLLCPGGRLVAVDYQRHADEAFRERQADVWNGFEAEELEQNARAAGLREARVTRLPAALLAGMSDGHIGWHALSGVRPATSVSSR